MGGIVAGAHVIPAATSWESIELRMVKSDIPYSDRPSS